MRTLRLFILCTVCYIITACSGHTTHVSYSKRISPDSTYSVDIPKKATKCINTPSLMAFVDDNSHLYIYIYRETTTPQDLYQTQKHDNSFTATILEDNDSIYIVKYTRGAMNTWAAYDCTSKVNVGATDYIVNISSDNLNERQCRETLCHITSSIKSIPAQY